MTPYQRGARDALLALAAELEQKTGPERPPWPAKGSNLHADTVEMGLRAAATLARRRSEALPHDPEGEVKDP